MVGNFQNAVLYNANRLKELGDFKIIREKAISFCATSVIGFKLRPDTIPEVRSTYVSIDSNHYLSEFYFSLRDFNK